ncbi:MAG: hypothetical protein HKL96_06425 [Phycisphaerales bacterium]|nr:hypothetical protein [Phycisphaerales bacterium]
MMKQKYRKRKAVEAAPETWAAAVMAGIDSLNASLNKGDALTSRQVQIKVEKAAYTPERIVKLRRRLGISQPLFADFIGASPIAVQKWEQGKRRPNAIARRFLSEIEHDPAHWKKRLSDCLTAAN